MKTTGRLLLLGLFAVTGIVSAVCVGTLIQSPVAPSETAPQLAAVIRVEEPDGTSDRGLLRSPVHASGQSAMTSDDVAPLPSDLKQVPLQTAKRSSQSVVILAPPHGCPTTLKATDIGRKARGLAPTPAAPLPPVMSTTSTAKIPPAALESIAPQWIAPGEQYGQEAEPTINGVPMKDMMELLRKGLDDSEKPSSAPPVPSAEPASKKAEVVPAPSPIVMTPRKESTVNGEGDGKLRVRIHDEDIRKVLDLLSEQGNLNILASKNVQGKVSASLNSVDIESALNAILKSTGFVLRREANLIFVGTPEEFENIEEGLDRIGTRVFRPSYITANELKQLITPLLTEKIGVVSISTQAEAGIPNNDTNAGGDSFSGGDVVVVRDFEAVLSQIDQMVMEVDVRPMQVSIEAMILSVKLQDEDKFGVNFQLLRQNPNIRFGLGAPPTALTDAAFPLNGGLKFGFLDSNLGAFIEALETVGDTNVIANPRLMVLNKQRAEIQIGEKKGYISQTITETSSSRSVEFLDIGAQLRLRPFISNDGLIRMEVHPELSDGDVKVENDFTLPNKTLTQVTTNIMVRDGCTVIIGGLIKEQLTSSTSQIPVLGNLPVVGFAFRQSTENIERHEVLVLITPRIVYEPGTCQDGCKQGGEFLRRQSTYADKMSPFGKRSIARRYFRLAQKAYAEGDSDKALWFAEMAVQFDPLNASALELRTDIWQGKPYSPSQGDAGVPLDNPMEGQGMAGWLIDDLEKPTIEAPVPMHPLDPGVSGSHRDLTKPTVLK